MKNRTNITIALLGGKTYPPEIGGIETHIYHLSRELKNLGIRTIILTGKSNQKMPSYEKEGCLEIYRVAMLRNRYLLKMSMVLPIFSKLRKLKKNIDIYHAHDSVFGFFLSILGYRPLIYTAHGCAFLRSDWPFPIRKILEFMEKMVFKKANAIICVDNETKRVISKFRKDNVYVIPNGIDPQLFEGLNRPREFPQDKIIIFSSGRLIPSKGFQDLIEAYLMLPEEIKNKTELFIAGKGPMFEQLRKKASQDDRIHLLGYVEDIKPYFTHADIFVLPSHYEGFPFTLLEAMAAKTACISTNMGDIPMRFKNGEEIILVPAMDIANLSEALKKVIVNESIRRKLAKEAYERILKEYLWNDIAKDILGIYSQLI